MKPRIYSLIVATLLLLSSCSQKEYSNKFIGEWRLVQAEFDAPNLDSAFVSAAKHSLESSIFYLEEENHFQIEDMSFTGGSYVGTWEYADENRQLTFTYTDLPIDPEIYDVLKVSRNKLVIRQNLESVGILEYHMERKE
jgi:major membrane immunogen (membrane-anchored lipoprotein)